MRTKKGKAAPPGPPIRKTEATTIMVPQSTRVKRRRKVTIELDGAALAWLDRTTTPEGRSASIQSLLLFEREIFEGQSLTLDELPERARVVLRERNARYRAALLHAAHKPGGDA